MNKVLKTYENYKYFLDADRIALGRPAIKGFYLRARYFILPDRIWNFQKLLRKYEYVLNNPSKGFLHNFRLLLLRIRFERTSQSLGFTIPPNVFGPGLSIAHIGTIIVNGSSKIGANCRIHACVNIGTEAGHYNKAPILGDNCYIGPGAKIFGSIQIASNCAIGANAVVNKSFLNPGMLIAGVPAREIHQIDVMKYIIPATFILESGINQASLVGLSANEIATKHHEDFIKSDL